MLCPTDTVTRDDLEFAVRQEHLKMQSILDSRKVQLHDRMWLELEGIKDILEYAPPEIATPIRERIARIYNIIEEE